MPSPGRGFAYLTANSNLSGAGLTTLPRRSFFFTQSRKGAKPQRVYFIQAQVSRPVPSRSFFSRKGRKGNHAKAGKGCFHVSYFRRRSHDLAKALLFFHAKPQRSKDRKGLSSADVELHLYGFIDRVVAGGVYILHQHVVGGGGKRKQAEKENGQFFD
jgi:hypothetical protein